MSRDTLAKWTLPVRRLITELSVGLARIMWERLGNGDDAPPGYIWHGATHAYEDACAVLDALGVASSADDREPNHRGNAPGTKNSGKRFPLYFKFFSEPDVRAVVMDGTPKFYVPLNEVLSAYIGVACGYGTDESRLCSGRSPFTPQAQFKREIDALIDHGYLERTVSEMIWTDKIAEAMQENHIWENDGTPKIDVIEAATAMECQRALDLTPEHTKRALSNHVRQMSELEFVSLLARQFDGLYWTRYPDGTAGPRSIRLVKAIYAALRAYR